MHRSFAFTAALGLAAVTCTLPTVRAAAAPAAARAPELADLVSTWDRIDDFEVTITSHEVAGSTTQDRRFRYSYLRPDHAKIEMDDGPNRGVVAVWNGGTSVVAHKRGLLGAFRRTFGLHDKEVTSLRGNGMTTPELGVALHCFASKEAQVSQKPGPRIDGRETIEVTLEDEHGVRCPSDSPMDAGVTRDAIDVDPATHLPVRRVRFAGTQLVEQWDLSDLLINHGLSANDFV